MIYTVTFNPAIDYVVQLEHLTQGTVNRTGDEAGLVAAARGSTSPRC